MAIKFVKKGVSDNKIQTPPKNPEKPTKPPHAPKLAALQSIPYTPFIDFMTINVKVVNVEHQISFFKSYHFSKDDDAFTKSAPAKKNWTASRRLLLEGDMKIGNMPILRWKITKPSAKQLQHIAEAQAAGNSLSNWPEPELGRVVDLSLDLWPRAMLPEQFHELSAALMMFVHDGFDYFHAHGKVTQIEATVDLANLKMTEVHVVPSMSTTMKTWSKEGHLETLTISGSKNGNAIRVYNRGEKRKNKKQDHPVYAGVRVERVLRRQKLTLPTLLTLKNPFEALEVVTYPSKPPDEPKDYFWQMFTDCVKLRSLSVALKLLPEEKKAIYRKWFKEHTHPKWDSAEIWSHWEEYLRESGIYTVEQHQKNLLAAAAAAKKKE